MDFMDTYGHLVTVNVVGCTALGRHLTVLNDESRRRENRKSFKFRDQLEEGFNLGRKTIGKKMKLLYENRSYKYLYIRLSWQFLLFLTTLNIFAAIYQAFEQGHDDEEDDEPFRTTKDIISNFSAHHNISESAIHKLFADWDKEDAMHGQTMSYMEAIILTLSVFYTIGWGQVIPRSTGGKLFCILSSCIGIPITFVMVLTGAKIFQRHMHDLVQFMYGGCKRKCDIDNEDYKNPKSAKLLVLTFTTVLLIYMLTTAGIIMAIEGFTYIDSLYYCFVSLSTIGFGDFIQQQLTREEDHGKAFGLTTFLFFWIMFGIIMVAANLLTILSIKMEDLISIPDRFSNFFVGKESTACLVENHHGQDDELLHPSQSIQDIL